jgi:hypothetical protein
VVDPALVAKFTVISSGLNVPEDILAHPDEGIRAGHQLDLPNRNSTSFSRTNWKTGNSAYADPVHLFDVQ